MRNKYVLKSGLIFKALKPNGDIKKAHDFYEGLFSEKVIKEVITDDDVCIKLINKKISKATISLMGSNLFKLLFKQVR